MSIGWEDEAKIKANSFAWSSEDRKCLEKKYLDVSPCIALYRAYLHRDDVTYKYIIAKRGWKKPMIDFILATPEYGWDLIVGPKSYFS